MCSGDQVRGRGTGSGFKGCGGVLSPEGGRKELEAKAGVGRAVAATGGVGQVRPRDQVRGVGEGAGSLGGAGRAVLQQEEWDQFALEIR